MITTLTQTRRNHALNLRDVLQIWLRNHTTRKTMRRLTTDQLADVGITQKEARTEGRKWFWQ